MNKTIIATSSVTHAIKLKNQLDRLKIKSEVIKVDSSKTKNGCTYGVRLQTSNIYDAINILKKNRINYSVIDDDIS